VFRLYQGWRACKGVRCDKGSWNHGEATRSSLL